MKPKFFVRLKDSLSRPAFAAEVASVWVTKWFSYILILFLLVALISCSVTLVQAYPLGGIDEINSTLASEIPNFELRNGQLRIDIYEPIIIDNGANVLIIDNASTAKIPVQYSYHPQVVYLGRYEMVVRQAGTEQSLSYSDLGIEFSRNDLQQIIRAWAGPVIILANIFGVFGNVISAMVFALILAIIGLIIGAIFKTSVRFGKMFELAIYASTLVHIINMLASVFSLTIPMKGFLGYIIAIVYLVLYLLAIKSSLEKQEMERQLAYQQNPPAPGQYQPAPYGSYQPQQQMPPNGSSYAPQQQTPPPYNPNPTPTPAPEQPVQQPENGENTPQE